MEYRMLPGLCYNKHHTDPHRKRPLQSTLIVNYTPCCKRPSYPESIVQDALAMSNRLAPDQLHSIATAQKPKGKLPHTCRLARANDCNGTGTEIQSTREQRVVRQRTSNRIHQYQSCPYSSLGEVSVIWCSSIVFMPSNLKYASMCFPSFSTVGIHSSSSGHMALYGISSSLYHCGRISNRQKRRERNVEHESTQCVNICRV